MILTVVQLLVRPEISDSFPYLMREFTEQTRAQAGNLWCTWSRNVEDPDEYTLNEAFVDTESAIEHATSDYFVEAMRALPEYLTEAPKAINIDHPGDGWIRLADLPFFVEQPAAMGRYRGNIGAL